MQEPIDSGDENLSAELTSLIRALKVNRIGKQTRTDLYVHRSVIETRSSLAESLDQTCLQFGVDSMPWNIAKFSLRNAKISLLRYPGFDSIAHPCLATAVRINFEASNVTVTDYRERDNRPVLHRKELLVDSNYEHRAVFHALTVQEEDAGLLLHANQIGYQKQWEQRLTEQGITIDGHSLHK